MTIVQPQVFISYQRADEVFARRVREHLHSHGVRTWMDQYDIPVGAYWPDEIDKGLSSSDIVLGVISPDSVESRNVKNEWDWAIQNDKPLLLLQYRPCVIPHRYISINYIDATGSSPSAALQQLLATLGVATNVAPHNEEAPPARAVQHGSRRRGPRRPPPQLAGRERDQKRLLERLGALMDDSGSVVLLAGEAGIGKTALTQWLVWQAEEHGVTVLSGGCYDLTIPPPYGPWVEILRQWSSVQSLPPLPAELQSGLVNVRSQAELFEIVTDLLARAAGRHALLLLLEDLQWSDDATIELLRYLTRPVTEQRMMLVATYRSDEIGGHPLASALPSLSRGPEVLRLSLNRLTDDATRALVAGRYALPDHEADRLATYVQRVSEGNPLFAGEVLQTLEEQQALTRDGDAWRVGNLGGVHVPDLVRELIESRLARLDANAQQLLEVAAVIGQETPVDLWVEVSGADETALSDAMERAIETRLIEELRSGVGFRFTHALVRETLYERVVLLRRRGLHRRVAEALAATLDPDPDIVANHFRQAGDGRARDWLIRAAARAARSYALTGAANRLELAIEYENDRHLQGWLWYRVGRHLMWSDQVRADQAFDSALAIAREIGDEALLAYATCDLGETWCIGSRYDRGLPLLEQGIALIEQLPAGHIDRLEGLVMPQSGTTGFVVGITDIHTPLTLRNVRRCAWVAFLAIVGRLDDAEEIGLAILAEADALGDRLTPGDRLALGLARYGLGYAWAFGGQGEQAAPCFEEALELNQRLQNRVAVLSVSEQTLAFITIPYHATDLGERDRLREVTRSALQYVKDELSPGGRGDVAFVEGLWDQIPVPAGNLDDVYEREPGIPIDNILRLAWRRGDRDAAWALVRSVLPNGPRTQPGTTRIHHAIPTIATAAELTLDDGNQSLARDWIDLLRSWLTWSGAARWEPDCLLLESRYHKISDDLEAAMKWARQALDSASSRHLLLTQLSAYRALGELYREMGDADTARSHIQAALDLADACRAPFDRALTLLALTELQVATGDLEAARQSAAEARTICEPLGARPTLDRIAALEQQIQRVGGTTR